MKKVMLKAVMFNLLFASAAWASNPQDCDSGNAEQDVCIQLVDEAPADGVLEIIDTDDFEDPFNTAIRSEDLIPSEEIARDVSAESRVTQTAERDALDNMKHAQNLYYDFTSVSFPSSKIIIKPAGK